MHIDDDGSVVYILCYPDRYLQDARVDWCLDRAVDAIPAIDEGGTGVQTSGVLQMLLDLGCDRCSHGDCITRAWTGRPACLGNASAVLRTLSAPSAPSRCRTVDRL